MNKKQIEDLEAKIDNEGGLVYYLVDYGGDLPKEAETEEKAFLIAYWDLVSKLQNLGLRV